MILLLSGSTDWLVIPKIIAQLNDHEKPFGRSVAPSTSSGQAAEYSKARLIL
jgi:hypothetical protein